MKPIHCACVIHGDVYDWKYVENLHSMLQRHLTQPVRLHVYTEESRPVPEPFIKHPLVDWGIKGPKKSWWYKIQMFNPENFSGPLLYFDLDVVITSSIDWIANSNLQYFWSVRDFKYLWRPTNYGVNSSIMFWDTSKLQHVWQKFNSMGVSRIVQQFHGDQDFLSHAIAENERRYLNTQQVKSWRWQCLDGGYDFRRRMYLQPNTGTSIDEHTSVLVFHGKPKPGEVADSLIVQNWQ